MLFKSCVNYGDSLTGGGKLFHAAGPAIAYALMPNSRRGHRLLQNRAAEYVMAATVRQLGDTLNRHMVHSVCMQSRTILT